MRIKGTLHEDQYIFSIICRLILLRMRKFADRFVEKLESHILYSGMQGGMKFHPAYQTSTKCRINTVVSPDDGHIFARNM